MPHLPQTTEERVVLGVAVAVVPVTWVVAWMIL
jgi:hypothetical protein